MFPWPCTVMMALDHHGLSDCCKTINAAHKIAGENNMSLLQRYMMVPILSVLKKQNQALQIGAA